MAYTHTAAPTSVASPPTTKPPSALALAQAAAVEYWGGTPCQGTVTIGYAPQTAAPQNATGGVATPPLSAWASFQTPDGPDNFADAPSSFSDCLITINNDEWPPELQQEYFSDFCALIVHEYGHFFGHPDLASDPPSSITYPIIGTQNEAIQPCIRRYPLIATAA